MKDALKNYVREIKKLPTLPVIAQEILTLVHDDMLSVQKLEQMAENDPVISAKILSAANSVYFGPKVRTRTLNSAIMRIGFNNVKNIALGVSLMTVFENGKRGKVFDYQRIYNHSVTVGFIAGLLSRELKMDIADEMLINGMIHDIGYLVLNRYFPDIYQKVIALYEEEQSLIESEEKVFGFTHAEIGRWLTEEWNLPGSIVDTTLYHHTPSRAKKHVRRVAVTHIADYVTTRNILSPTEKDPNYPFDHFSLEVLGISENDLKVMEAKISGGMLSEESSADY